MNTCATCRFYIAQPDDPGGVRDCHRFPPAVHFHIGFVDDQTLVTKYVGYPHPEPGWIGCGEYRSDPIVDQLALWQD